VLRDVINGKVSLERAKDVYGVVIDLAQRKVLDDATRDRRRQLAAVSQQQKR